jgi:hypothetical protein
MPQLQLPIFPDGTKEINRDLGVQCADGKVVYLHGHLPVFQHEENDIQSFRLFTSQLVANGVARARELVEAFGGPLARTSHQVCRGVKISRGSAESLNFIRRARSCNGLPGRAGCRLRAPCAPQGGRPSFFGQNSAELAL